MKRDFKRRNIQIFPKKIKYNALKKFKGDIIKIPSYIVDEVFSEKKQLEIYHNDKYITTYDYDQLFSFICRIEDKEYDGTYKKQDIKYKLTHVQV